MTIEICQGQTKNGGQCQRPVLPGNRFCSQHDPDRAEERSEIASLAGRAARPRLVLPDVDTTPACPTNATGIPAFTAKLIDATVRGKLDVRVANSAYYGLGLILKAVETAELERRVAELEQKMAQSHHTG